MAGIDKIFGTTEQWDEFYAWLRKNNPDAVGYLYGRDGYESDNCRPISNFPEKIDLWLWENCPIGFVRERLNQQYGFVEVKRMRFKKGARPKPLLKRPKLKRKGK